MKEGETKRSAFKRLANNRANRIIKNLGLLGNLSNKRNYDFTDTDIKSVFDAIEEEVRLAKARFMVSLKKGRKVRL